MNMNSFGCEQASILEFLCFLRRDRLVIGSRLGNVHSHRRHYRSTQANQSNFSHVHHAEHPHCHAARRRALFRQQLAADRTGPAHPALEERGDHRPNAVQPPTARGAHTRGTEHQLHAKTFTLALKVERIIFKTAASREIYLDEHTLHARVAQVSRRLIDLRKRKNTVKFGIRLPRQLTAPKRQMQ